MMLVSQSSCERYRGSRTWLVMADGIKRDRMCNGSVASGDESLLISGLSSYFPSYGTAGRPVLGQDLFAEREKFLPDLSHTTFFFDAGYGTQYPLFYCHLMKMF